MNDNIIYLMYFFSLLKYIISNNSIYKLKFNFPILLPSFMYEYDILVIKNVQKNVISGGKMRLTTAKPPAHSSTVGNRQTHLV